ncbi:MAG: ATP-binding protein [Pseudonocardiaceae bacterium]
MSQLARDASWQAANRDCLVAELGVLRARLRAAAEPGSLGAAGDSVAEAERRLGQARAVLAQRSALDEVSEGFGLSGFERSVLLLAAGPELVAATVGELAATGGGSRASFGLALSLLPDAHWSAITPPAPLRRWSLVRLVDLSSPTRSPLLVDERVLHHLTGAGYLDPELAVLTRRVSAPASMPATLARVTEALAQGWRRNRLVILHGPQRANLLAVAAAAARLGLFVLSAVDLPVLPADRERLLRLMERETVLGGAAWAVDVEGARPEDIGGLIRALSGVDAPVVVLGDAEALGVEAVRVLVPRLPLAERREAIADAVRRGGVIPIVQSQLDAVAGVFDLALPDLEVAAGDVAGGVTLWEACRSRSRSQFGGLARVIDPRAGWEDLVLPADQLEQLHALVAAVRHRARVLDDWGFAQRGARGLGTAALFAGPSGTGKTMAAEVIARELGLDLVVVDLSQVMSKYIGETEKNLRRIFDAAEDGAAVLLFDEADTLFGKRTEVRDSHDRYANLEVGYLLQRMDTFHGPAILTTNTKSTLDQAFLRRLRTIVTFPYPDVRTRETLWRTAFPAHTPVGDLDPRRLATMDLPGGGIAAAALTAAFLGADNGVVSAADVAAATRWELAKFSRSATPPRSQRQP